MVRNFCKASVLTRMGYPIRNTIDGQLRAALALGSIAKTDEVLKTFKKNLGTRAKLVENFFDETLSSTRPSQLNTQIGELIQRRQDVINVRESILDELAPKAYYANASGTFGKQVTPEMVELAISSKSKPLLKDADRSAYFELMSKRKQQKGLLFGKDKKKFESLQGKAFSKYVREEVVPTLPKGTTLVYADYLSGKVFYKIPGNPSRICIASWSLRKIRFAKTDISLKYCGSPGLTTTLLSLKFIPDVRVLEPLAASKLR